MTKLLRIIEYVYVDSKLKEINSATIDLESNSIIYIADNKYLINLLEKKKDIMKRLYKKHLRKYGIKEIDLEELPYPERKKGKDFENYTEKYLQEEILMSGCKTFIDEYASASENILISDINKEFDRNTYINIIYPHGKSCNIYTSIDKIKEAIEKLLEKGKKELSIITKVYLNEDLEIIKIESELK